MGGKSRKSGGVSKRLIDTLRKGSNKPTSTNQKKKANTDVSTKSTGFGFLSQDNSEQGDNS